MTILGGEERGGRDYLRGRGEATTLGEREGQVTDYLKREGRGGVYLKGSGEGR